MPAKSPVIFVFHPKRPSTEGPSVRSQLEAFSLECTAIPEPPPENRTPRILAKQHGEHIFRLDDNPYRRMSPTQVARAAAYPFIAQRMDERGSEIACILEEGVVLNEHFPALLRSSDALGGDWDILILGCAGAPPQALRFRRRPRLYKDFRMARPARLPGKIAGFLIRRKAAQKIRNLILPIQAPVEQYLHQAEQYGMRLRFMQPAVLHQEHVGEGRVADDAQAQAMWEDWMTSVYSAEYLDLLGGDALQAQSEDAPSREKDAGEKLTPPSLRARLLARAGLIPEYFGARELPARAVPLKLPEIAGADACDVVVIIPLFNRERFIIPVIQSLERQTRPPQRLIVVDDGSSDNSAKAVERFFADAELPFAAEMLRHEQNRGLAATRNTGLRQAADCDFVYFLDSDDCPPRDFLQRAVAQLAQEPEAVATSADRLFVYGRGRLKVRALNKLPGNPKLWFLLNGAGNSSTTLFRRSVFERAGMFDPGLRTGEDTDMFHRIAGCGEWLHLPGAPVMMLRASEHDNLSRDDTGDGWRKWTYIWENNLYRRSGMQLAQTSVRRNRLHRVWVNSGVALRRGERFTEANECFRRALACRFSIKSLLHLKTPALPFPASLTDRFLHLLHSVKRRPSSAVASVSPKRRSESGD